MRRFLLIGLVWASCLIAVGQNLNKIEYFIDTEPGYGNGTNVPFTAAPTVTGLTFSVSITSVTDGFHALYVRSRDANNKWSVVQYKPFYKIPAVNLTVPNLSLIEYFIDTDPGFGAATSVPFTAGTSVSGLVFPISITSLADGFHTLFIRSKDANNKWGVVQAKPFYKIPAASATIPNLSLIEYFIDTDPGFGAGTSVPFTAGNTASGLAFNVPITSLTDGFHTLYMRSKDANNKWSVVQSRPFYKIPAASLTVPALSRIEYFIDTDPGYGVATSVPFTAGTSVTDLIFSIDVSSLSVGAHKLYVRSKDANNKWSVIVTKDISVCNQAIPAASAATGITTTGFTANWAAASGATSYALDVSADNFATFVSGYNNLSVSAITKTVTGLASGVAYKYRVRAVSTCSSISSASIDVTTLVAPPSTPVATAATAISSTGFTANWNAATGAASYQLDISTDNFTTFITGYNSKSISTTTEVVTGLNSSTLYKYRVRAVNSGGTSTSSTAISVTTLAGAPAAPVASTATSITPTGFVANWAAVTGATGYQLDISTDNFATFITGYNAKALTGLTETVSGLNAATAYKYRVRSSNANGLSVNSNVIDVTTAAKQNQTITFAALSAKSSTDAPFTLTATASSNLPVSYSSSNTAVATISGSTVTIVAVGTTTITASQSGDANFNAATSVTQTLTVTTKQSQTITFAALAAKTFGDAAFTLAATASSQLAVSYASSNTAVATISANTVTIVGAGNSTITASQAGDATFGAATNVTQTLTVNKASQTITFAALPAKFVGNAAFALTATGGASGLPVTFVSSNTTVATISGSTVTIVAAGTTNITASQAGNDNYSAATDVVQVLTVTAKQNQIITFAALADKTLGDAAFTLTATASSNLPVAYSTTSDKITISGNQVTLVKAGRASVVANQAGNDAFNAATAVTQSFCIKPARPTITLSNTNTETVTLTSSASSGNQWYLAGTAIAGATNTTLAVTAPGVYKVQVKVDDCLSDFSADQTIIVTGDIKLDGSVISISPNPVDNVIQLNGIVGEIKSNQLFDMTGRATAPLTFEKKNEVYQALVEHLSQGVYVLRILQDNKVVQVKFVKK